MYCSRISNLPFLYKPDGIYESTTKSHFRLIDSSSIPVIQPKITNLTMHRTNFKMTSGDRSGDFVTTQSDFKLLPMSKAKLVRPVTKVRISVPEGKYPEPTYGSSYTKHEVSPILIAKESGSAGVGSSLRQEKKNRYDCSYQEQFLYSGCPPLSPLESIEKQRVQYSAVPMGDREKIQDKQTTYSIFFRQSVDHSPESLLYKRKKRQPFKLRQLRDDEWTTISSEEFPSHECGPIHLERRCPTLSSVFKGEKLTGNQESLSTTNQSFLSEINRSEFPVHVDGPSIRTLSNVTFGRPDLAGKYYSTTSQEQFSSKEVLRPKPSVYPPSHMLLEQESDQMLTTIQKDFVPLNSRRQELSPSQLQRVKDCHIKPRQSKHDFRTTHNETYVFKPYCKASQDNSSLRNISHMPF
ncbi:uncharacterized protein si:ch211-198o12.4 [Onychostoma macrolepis]|uniref:uncharacterized protein si:ch211-198o12.4 n=1 Tax=Onychostoma macrolepis TaxID=369639 RepID=UPI00272B44DA|nr:uncharacterized protein si:ch211-198o12.4 [Onychostoma macrolepis]